MNPFKYGTVVEEPFFFDRQDELKQIVETLKGGNNIVLYAPRRYGKTSLVIKAMREMENDDYQCIYLDIMTVYSRESFIETYSKAILVSQSQWKKTLKIFSDLIKGIKPSLSFDRSGNPEFSIDFIESKVSDVTLEAVIGLPGKLADHQHPFIIIMDEFSHQRLPLEQDIQKLNGENFEDLLRSKIQHHKYVNYLFLGSKTHLLNDMFSNKNRPFYNSALTMNIGPLPYRETVEYLTNHFSDSDIMLSEENAAHLIDTAGNIPYYIQFLASVIWQDTVNTSKIIEPELINRNADKILELKQDYYFELFDRCTSYQKKLLRALAISGHNIYSNDYARKFRLSAPSTTQKAMDSLINDGIIDKQGNHYLFNDPFFKRYILRLSA